MKLFQKPVWLLLCLSITPSPILWAASHPPTIVVSASRVEQNSIDTPASITIVTREEIEGSGAANLLQLLQARGGVQIDSLFGNGNGATIDMRGFGSTASRNTLVLVDGRRLNNSADSASPDLNSIELSRIERIEIVQGSAGTLYGNQAVGGMINIVTRRPADFSASVEAGISSFHGRSLTAHMSQRIGNDLAYRLSAGKRTGDNYRDNSESDRADFNLRLDYEHNSGDLFLEQQLVDDYQQLPGALFHEELANNRRQAALAYADDYSDTRSHITRLGMTHEINRYWSFEGEASYRNNDREFKTSFRSFSCDPSTQDRKVKGLNPRIVGHLPFKTGNATLTTGLDLERTDYDLLSCVGPQTVEQSVNSFYLQLTAPLSEVFTGTVGWRRSRVDNAIESSVGDARLKETKRAGSLGLVYRPEARLRLFARLDENYRFATVDEHTNVFFLQPVGLENQSGRSHELGAEWQDSGYRAKAVLYRLDLEKEISFDTTGFYNINLEKTRREGVILEASWQATEKVTIAGSFTYTDPTISAGPHKDKRIPLVSARSARLSLDWQPVEQWQFYTEAILRSDRVFGGDFSNNFDALPGYGLLNAGGHYDNGPWRIGLRVDNLLDKEYLSSGSIGYDAFFTPREGYFPGSERNLWLTARYQFE